MNTVPRRVCQTRPAANAPRVVPLWLAVLILAGWLPIAVCAATGDPAPTPASSAAGMPAWEQELGAARLLEASVLATATSDPSAAAARADRMSKVYATLSAKYPEEAPVQKASGEFAWRRHHVAEAIELLRRAAALAPADAEIADTLGSAFVEANQMRDARSELARAVRLVPTEPAYHFAYANVLYLFRHEFVDPPPAPDESAVLALAMEQYRLAADLAPGDLLYAQGYAETFYNLPKPDWQQALTAWKAVLRLSGENTDLPNCHLARVSLRLGQPEEADRYLASVRDPAFATLKEKLHGQAVKLGHATN